MGFYYRKSVNISPFLVNVSKSGVGYSVGGRGFRTGVGYRTTHADKGCLLITAGLNHGNRLCRGGPPMKVDWKRTLRTSSSERFLATRDGTDVAAVDLHFLVNGTVSRTVILLKEAAWKEEEITRLLQSLDEEFLPDVDLAAGTLSYTVLIGEMQGSWQASVHE